MSLYFAISNQNRENSCMCYSFVSTYLGGNNLVCEFCKEKQLSSESLERHTLAVHGAIGIQNPEGNL